MPTIRDTAKVRVAALKKGYPKMPATVKQSQDVKAVQDRISQEKELYDEVGGRKKK